MAQHIDQADSEQVHYPPAGTQEADLSGKTFGCHRILQPPCSGQNPPQSPSRPIACRDMFKEGGEAKRLESPPFLKGGRGDFTYE